jgi:hypothetical protein
MLSLIHFGSHHPHAATLSSVVQVVAPGEAGLAGPAEDLALLELLAFLDVDRAQVATSAAK